MKKVLLMFAISYFVTSCGSSSEIATTDSTQVFVDSTVCDSTKCNSVKVDTSAR